MAAPSMQIAREPERRFDAVQSLLKYAVLFSALSYALGFQIESNYYAVLRVPWRVDAADTPQLLYRGFYSIFAVSVGVFFSLGFREAPIRLFRRNITTTLVWLAPGVCTFAFTVPWLDIPDNNYNIASCVLFYVVAAYLFFFAFDPSDKESHAMVSVVSCLLAVYCLLWGATCLGSSLAIEKIYSGPNARLVLTPDTPEAALQGVRVKPGKQCLVSEPVDLFEVGGDSFWLILPNKTTVSIRKDKVLGTLVPRDF